MVRLRLLTIIAGFFLLFAFGNVPVSETVAGLITGAEWVLEEVSENPAPVALRIRFNRSGRLRGTGPCNTFRARQTAPMPWFNLEGFSIGKDTCPELAAETELLGILSRMGFAEAAGAFLLLSNVEEETLLFRLVDGARP